MPSFIFSLPASKSRRVTRSGHQGGAVGLNTQQAGLQVTHTVLPAGSLLSGTGRDKETDHWIYSVRTKARKEVRGGLLDLQQTHSDTQDLILIVTVSTLILAPTIRHETCVTSCYCS